MPTDQIFKQNRGANLPSMGSGAGLGGGSGVTAVVGLANVIGAVAQNAGVIANKFAARRQLIGPIYQGGNMVYTQAKGKNQINQLSGNSLNALRGRIQMNQAGNSNTVISGGRVRINPTGLSNHNIYGNVRGIRGNNHINTGTLKITGVSTAKSLFVREFHAPKGTKIRLMQIVNGDMVRRHYRLNSGEYGQGNYYGFAINDTLLQKINGYSINRMNYNTSKSEQVTMMSLRKVFLNPENKGLPSNAKIKMVKVQRMREEERILTGEDSTNGYSRKEEKYYADLLRTAVQEIPNISAKEIKQITDKAYELKKANERKEKLFARAKADEKYNVNEADKASLNTLLQKTSGVASNFNKFVEDNFKDDRIHELSEAEMKQIEQKARQIVDAREGLSMDEKQRQYEEETKMMSDEKKKRNLAAAQELIKQQILDDPDSAEDILGKEGVELLKKEFGKNRKEKEAIFQRTKRNNERLADEKFRDEHPEYATANAYEIHTARQKEENIGFIEDAIKATKPENKQDNYQNASYVYIPQSVQEAMAARANARRQANQSV